MSTGSLSILPRRFAYYRKQGIEQVVCEEKHMGSRAIFIICRDEAAARKQFGASEGEIGVCYTRTGRRFFQRGALEAEVLVRLQAAISSAGWWEAFETDWVCLDTEVMPWSAKAQELLKEQYAAVGAAATARNTGCDRSARTCGTARRQLGRRARPHPRARSKGCSVCRGVPALLVDGRVRRRHARRALPSPSKQRQDIRRPRSRLAYADPAAACRG